MSRLIGIENEYIGVKKNGDAMTRTDVVILWKKLAKAGWKSKIDTYNGELLGAYKKTKYGVISIDNDGGAPLVEVSYPPYPDIHTTKKEQKKVISLLNKLIGKNNRLLGYGCAPFTNPKDVALTPKCYYPDLLTIVNEYKHMQPFFMEGATQINIGGTLKELHKALNLFFRLDAILYALFANTPIHKGKISEYKDIRGKHYDNLKKGLNKTHRDLFCMNDRPFRSWKEYVVNLLDRPGRLLFAKNKFYRVLDKRKLFNIFTERKQLKVREVKKTYFKNTKEKKAYKKHKLEQEIELDIHDTLLTQNVNWLDVRLRFSFKENASTEEYIKKLKGTAQNFEKFLEKNLDNQYIEIRPVSTQQPKDQMIAPAFCLGLIENMKKAQKLMERNSWKFWHKMRVQAYTHAMDAKVGNVPIDKFFKPLYEIAYEGLKKRKKGEEIFLEPLKNNIENHVSPADMAKKIFKTKSKKEFLDSLTITPEKI
jgi:gamma-glutamylcysteine synthetase